MTKIFGFASSMFLAATVAGDGAAQQQPPQFKAALKTKNGTDNSTSTGTIYFGGAKIRTELTTDGQNSVVLVDPAAKSAYILIPDEKAYMQAPLSGGPASAAVTGPSDPANPCAAGSGNTDCARGENERLNGYETVRWDYTSAEGVRTRAWISARLHFAIKTQDDNGSSTEISNIAEGTQSASLFGIPSGYTKMDVGMMGAAGRGRGRGRTNANANDPVATAMANMPPELQAQMAAAMRGEGPKGPTGPSGSGWEKTKGWVINLTVEGTGVRDASSEAAGVGLDHETFTVKLVGAIPLNVLGGASGLPGAPGPSWQLMYTDLMGSPEVLATPATFSATVTGRIDRSSYRGDFKKECDAIARALASGFGVGDPTTSVGTVKGEAKMRIPITKQSLDDDAQGLFRIAADLKTYDLFFGLATKGKETTETRTDTKACRDGKIATTNDTKTAAPDYTVQFEFKGLPMPSTVGPVSGSKKMPLKVGDHQVDATVSWTIAPIR
jgi:hypothetical protein